MRYIWICLFGFMLAACQPAEEPGAEAGSESEITIAEMDRQPESQPAELSASERLDRILESQPEEVKARYDQRHPAETLAFFGIEPGMTVVEALPGRGWYSKILLPYLGREGRLIGANYPISLFEQFDFATEEYLASLANWPETFPGEASQWCAEDCASVDAFWFGQLRDDLNESADAVLFVRALHNMARFQSAGVDDYLDQALGNAYDVLKPGGVLGIVQHEARETMPDEWAAGGPGYLKKSFVIAQAEAAGFELEAQSAINENPADQPTESDVVWRLPPSLDTRNVEPERVAETVARNQAIGESHRMTLKLRKPLE